MKIACIPENELARIAALARYDVLDTPPEPAFDKLVELAAHLCHTPIAVISLVDSQRQWFKAVVGLDARETSRDVAFCAHAILGNEPFIVTDALLDERFADNPLVTQAPNIRFYAGIPLVTPDNYTLGTLCVIDNQPRVLDTVTLEALQILAAQAAAQLELRLASKRNRQYELDLQSAKIRQELAQARLEDKKRYQQMFDDAASCSFVLDPVSGNIIDANSAASAYWGYSRSELLDMNIANISALSSNETHTLLANLQDEGTHRIEWRHRLKNGQIRDIEMYSGPLAVKDRILLYAVIHDITDRKQAELRLNLSELKYRSLMQNIPDVVWSTDQNGKTSFVSDNVLKTLGYCPEEIYDDPNLWLNRIHKDDYEKVFRAFSALIVSGTQYDVEYRFQEKQGAWVWLHDRSVASYEKDGVRYADGVFSDITAGKLAELQLKKREGLFSAIFDHATSGIELTDPETLNFVEVNSAACHMLGYTHEEYLAMRLTDTLAGYSVDEIRRSVRHVQEEGALTTESRHRRKDGTVISVEVNAQMLELPDTKLLVAIWNDITDRKKHEESLRITASVFENSQEAIMIMDADHRILDINPAFCSITGYAREEVLGKPPDMLSSELHDTSFYEQMWRELALNKVWRGEVWNKRKTGENYAALLSIAIICDEEGRTQRHVAVFSDINYLKAHEKELSQVANYDELTGIPNRRLLADRLNQALVQVQRSGRMIAVCYIDLDGFKQVNDRFGHDLGDKLLVEVTRRLQESLRAGDTLARLGGDEFVLLFNDLSSEQECLNILDRILEAVAMPHIIEGEMVSVSASIGVAFHGAEDGNADSLLRRADQAMYIAKQSGKSRYHLYAA